MTSRIPRAAVLQPQNPNVPAKRKLADSSKDEPAGKRTATTAAAKVAPIEELELWAQTSEETGWDVVDCLQHKLAFANRVDAKAKVAALATHVKRLRAAGWSVVEAKERLSADSAGLTQQLDAELSGRATDEKEHAAVLQRLSAKAAAAEQRAEELHAQSSLQAAEAEGLRCELIMAASSLKAAQEAALRVEADLSRQEAATAAAQERLSTAESAASDSQRYASQLQEFNGRLQGELAASIEALSRLREEKAELAEEAAASRGRVAALGDALSALQSASASGEAARQGALEEAARLRAELASASSERAALAADAHRLRSDNDEQRRDLERYRAATGRDVAALEAEKAGSAALAGRTQAQAALNSALQEQLEAAREQRAAAEASAEAKSDQVRALAGRVAELEVLLDEAVSRAREGEAVRRRLHNTILELKGNVRVFCRVRPAAAASSSAVSVPTEGELAGRGVVLLQPAEGSGTAGGGAKGKPPQRHAFTFDRVFGPGAGQDEVFEEASALVQSALDGYRVCIFAYGQTNAGKTHTMLGTPGAEGIIPRAVRQVFDTAAAAEAQGWRYEMRAAMLEIYNEEVRDLLGPGPPAGKKHQISHDERGAASVSGLEWVDVSRAEGVAALLARAMRARAVGSTASNEQSSRSHMVFMLSIEGANEATGQRLRGGLNLVDLAGSERLGKSGAEGERLKETQAINKSLSALGDVIAALGAREAHVPYRNSKLTFLLQGSLGGAGKALMLCCCQPAAEAAQETLCTLRFAAKVNATEIGTARRNVGVAGGERAK